MVFSVPYKGNLKLERLVQKMNRNHSLQTYWKCSNVFAMSRMGFSDHGPTHVKIVANIALRILRILVKKGIVPNVVKDYKMSNEDAEVIVVLASSLHDIGMAVTRDMHEEYGVAFAARLMDDLLSGEYSEEERVIVQCEVVHAILSHHRTHRPLTIEAGIVRVSDALDMEKGRARIPFASGKVNIHSVSALSIENVQVMEGGDKPVEIKITMSNSAGIFQVDELLRQKVKNSLLEDYLRIVGEISGEKEKRIFKEFEISSV